jgi:hypothetical protein
MQPQHAFSTAVAQSGSASCLSVFFAAGLAPNVAQAEWITRNEAIMGTRCAVELWSDDKGRGMRP